MQIVGAQVGNILYPLTEWEVLPIAAGETLKVFYAFKYKMPETAMVEIWASLYRYTAGVLDRSSQAQTKETITLAKSLDWKLYEGEIDIVVGVGGGLGGIVGIGQGLYGLICELPDYDVEHHIDDCLDVAAAPSIWGMIGPLLIIGLLAMMIPVLTPKE
ncbi:hypothetical protein ES706_05186 [subsurface metagenome]